MIGRKGIISVKNCPEFSQALLDNKSARVFFDMGSICATVTSVHRDRLECSIQNEGTIYENSQISFSTYKEDPTSTGNEADLLLKD